MSSDSADHSEETSHVHDQAAEVAHAWHHFRDNVKFFAGFLSIILLTVFAFNINFGSWNTFAVLVLAAMRSGLIAIFLASLFKTYSFVFRALTFTAIFLAGMIFLSLWDSEVRGIGDPIKDRINVTPENHVP